MKKKYVIHFDTGRTWRGGQNQVRLLMAGLKEFDINQLLITPKESLLEEKAVKMNIPVINIDPINDIDIFSGIKFRKLIKNENPDIVHFHTAKSLGVGNWALRGLNVKTVFTRRVDFPMSGSRLNMIKYNFPDKLVVISDFIKMQMENLSFKNVSRIYSTVDLEGFQFKGNSGNNKNELNIGMIGSLDLKHKDFITFIKAAGEVKKQLVSGKKINFLIAGTGKDEKKVKRLIKDMSLEGYVKIAGFVEDIAGFISSLDLLVHTVHFEGLGTSILQSMAVGVPVIATGVGGISELIKDAENGCLVKRGDYREVSEKIISLINNPDVRCRYVNRSLKVVEEIFSKKKMIERYSQLYNELAE